MDVGDYEEESAAAYAVNVASRLTGQEPPNYIALSEQEGAAILAPVEKILRDKGIIQ